MPQFSFALECPLYDSFRVQQVAGLFDVPLQERLREEISVEVPPLDDPWQIGLIVGPSGSGKSTLAKAWLGGAGDLAAPIAPRSAWPEDQAVIDAFGDWPWRRVTELLTAVGFSSPPQWIRPYRTLSTGERFRCDLARALATEGTCATATAEASDGAQPSTCNAPPRLVVFDEFTSVVDRNVARIGSAAVAQAIRRGLVKCRFVAVTCHYDVAPWLEPDWMIDMGERTFTRRRLRRPELRLEIGRCRRALWSRFARHHYLSGRLGQCVRCYAAWWEGAPVAFCAVLPLIGRRGHWRISRLVVAPEYQGIGIGTRLAEAIAQLYAEQGLRMNITASHPALLAHCQRSPRWRLVRVLKTGSRRCGRFIHNYRGSRGRAVASFEFVRPP